MIKIIKTIWIIIKHNEIIIYKIPLIGNRYNNS